MTNNSNKGDRQMTTKSNMLVEQEMMNISNAYIKCLTELRRIEDLLDRFRRDCPWGYAGNAIKIANILNDVADERICVYRDMPLDIQFTETNRKERVIIDSHRNFIEKTMGAIKMGLAVPLDTIKQWEAAQNG